MRALRGIPAPVERRGDAGGGGDGQQRLKVVVGGQRRQADALAGLQRQEGSGGWGLAWWEAAAKCSGAACWQALRPVPRCSALPAHSAWAPAHAYPHPAHLDSQPLRQAHRKGGHAVCDLLGCCHAAAAGEECQAGVCCSGRREVGRHVRRHDVLVRPAGRPHLTKAQSLAK